MESNGFFRFTKQVLPIVESWIKLAQHWHNFCDFRAHEIFAMFLILNFFGL